MDPNTLAQLNEAYQKGVYEKKEIISDLKEAKVDSNLTPLQKVRKRNQDPSLVMSPGQQTAERRYYHQAGRGVKKERGEKSAFGTMRNVGGPYKEELDLYDLVSEYLVSEGYCDSYEDADVIMANMSEEWREGILEAFKPTDYNTGTSDKARKINRTIAKHVDSGNSEKAEKIFKINKKSDTPKGRNKSQKKSRLSIVSEYLVSEGYCDSYKEADAIMANMIEDVTIAEMIEDWENDILEQFKPTGYAMGYRSPMTGRGKKARQIDAQIKKLRASGKEGQAKSVDFVNRMQDTPEGRAEVMSTSRRNKSKADARARRDAQKDSRE
jgi:hypothetical protein